MKSQLILGSTVFFLAVSHLTAGDVFRDTFAAADGTSLNGWTPEVGNAWTDNSGLTIQGGAVDTSASYTDYTFAYGVFTTSLSVGNVLQLNFDTLLPASGNFFTTGWAGISLFAGDSDEEFFLGNASQPGWGILDYGNGRTLTLVPGVGTTLADAAQSVQFSYAYDTGNWTYTVGTSTVSGTSSSGLNIDRVRIGADEYNYADIAVSDIDVAISPVPEPSTSTILFSGFLLSAFAFSRSVLSRKLLPLASKGRPSV